MFDHDDMKAYTEKFFANHLMTWFLMSNQVFQSYISGLVSFCLYRETRDPLWAEKGANAQAKLQLWEHRGHCGTLNTGSSYYKPRNSIVITA